MTNKFVLGDLDTDDEVDADRAAASIAARSEETTLVDTNGPFVSKTQMRRGDMPTSVSVVRRIYVPPPTGPTLTPAGVRDAQRWGDLFETMQRWRHTYTEGTRADAENLVTNMGSEELQAEGLELDPSAEARLQSITDRFFDDLKNELSRKPEDDPNQQGNVDGIWNLWYAAFTDQLALEQFAPEQEDVEPGDYPQPENPLDVPENGDEDGIA
jgi:hypothetical protein